jgi:uncharacterized protein YdeI (YjbR/CyaY-like superfamily)
MKDLKLLYVPNRKDWRAWLKKNHKKESEIWLVYYKKHTGKDRVPYDDAVEEALCFGWIDSIIRRLDEDRFAQKFTPRKDSSTWSESNIKRIAKLENTGLMTAAGIKMVEIAKKTGKWDKPVKSPDTHELHPEFEKVLKTHPKAKKYFYNLAPSYRKHYTGWISAAKREETLKKRIKEAIALLNKNQKLGMK